MKKSLRALLRGVLVAGLTLAGLVIISPPAQAAVNCDTTWGGGSGMWFDAAHWSNGVPNASKDACIDGTAAEIITIESQGEVRVLTITNPNAVVRVQSNCCYGGDLATSGAIVNAGTIEFIHDGSLKSLSAAATLTNTGTLRWPAGGGYPTIGVPVINNGTMVIRRYTRAHNANGEIVNNGTVDIDGATLEVHNSRFTNNGTVNGNATGVLVSQGGSTFEQSGTAIGERPVVLYGGNVVFTVANGGRLVALSTVNVNSDIYTGNTIAIESNCCYGGDLKFATNTRNDGRIEMRGSNLLGGTTPDVTLTNWGTIAVTGGGEPTFGMPIVNNGAIIAGQPPATLNVRNVLTLTNNSTWKERITSSSQFDRMWVNGGKLNVDGHLYIAEQPATKPDADTSVRVAFGGPITGKFLSTSQILWPDGFGWKPVYDNSFVDLRFQNLVAPGAVAPTITPIEPNYDRDVAIEGDCTAGDRIAVRITDTSATTDDLSLREVCTPQNRFWVAVQMEHFLDGIATVSVTMTAPDGQVTALPIATADTDLPEGPEEPAGAAPTVSITDPIAAYNADDIVVDGTCVPGGVVTIVVRSANETQLYPKEVTCAGNGTYAAHFVATGLSDGTVTASVTQTVGDATSAAGTDTATKDTTAPAPATVKFKTVPISAANQGAVRLIGTCEAGSTLRIAFTVAGKSLDRAATRTCTAATFDELFDLRNTVDGMVRATVFQADTFGNSSTAAVDDVRKDTVAPSAPSVSIVTDPIGESNQENVVVSGTCESNTRVNLTLSDTAAGTRDVLAKVTCGSSQYQVTVNASSLADGVITASAVQTDVGGNVSPAGTDTASKSVPPTPVAGSIDITPAYINSGNFSAVPLAGTCVSGNKVDIRITDAKGAALALPQFSCPSNGTYTRTVNTKPLAEGTVTASAVQTGARAHAPHTDTATKDTIGPKTGDGSIDVTPAFLNAKTNLAAVPFTGTCVPGNEVRAAGGDGTRPPGEEAKHEFLATFTCPTSGKFSRTFDARSYNEGYISVAAVQLDAAGNNGAAVAETVLKDTLAPVAVAPNVSPSTVRSDGSEAAVTISGPCAAKGSGVLKVNDTDATTPAVAYPLTCPASGSYKVVLDLRGLIPSKLTIGLALTDEAGNAGSDTVSSVQKVVNRAIDITPDYVNASNVEAVPYSGKCSTGARVSVVFTDSQRQRTLASVPAFACPANNRFSGSFDGRDLAEDTIVEARTTEQTASGIALGFSIDTAGKDTRVSSPTVRLTSIRSEADARAARVSGTCETGATVAVSVVDRNRTKPPVAATAVCVDSRYETQAMDLSGLPNGALTVTATQIDRAGNVSAPRTASATKRA